MKSKLIALLLALSAPLAFSHGGVELGPNGGRLLELSKNESLHGEVTLKGDKFHVALLGKDMKPVEMKDAVVTVTAGDRSNPKKLEVEKAGDHYTFPAVKAGEWVIVQIKENAKAKAVTARFEFDPSTCDKCKAPEWLCKCESQKK